MERFAQEFLDRLNDLHAQMEQAVAGLPVEALDWVPGPEMNSIGVLVVHTLGAERWLLGDVLAGESSNRDRAAEFEAGGRDAGALTALLAGASEYARHALEPLVCGDLNAPRVRPNDGREVTVAWVLAHAIGHAGLHLGHVQITRQLWAMKPGD